MPKKLRNFSNYSRSALYKRRKIQLENERENRNSDLSDAESENHDVSEPEDLAVNSVSEESDSFNDEDATSDTEQHSTNEEGSCDVSMNPTLNDVES